MQRLVLMLSLIALNACSATYMDRGIPAPIESRDGTAVDQTPRMGRVVPGPAPTQDNAARTFPSRTGVPGVDDVTPPSPPVTTSPTTTYPPSGSRPPVPPRQDDVPPARQETRPVLPAYTERQDSGSPAAALLASVDAAMAEGELERAAALAERALRISPRDGYLWYRLADIRYQQERYTDAAGFAQRARSYAGSNRQLNGAIDDLLERANDAAR